MRFTRIYSAEDGTARFEDDDISFASSAFAPPAPPLDVSSPVPAREMLFIHFPAGWTDPAHPAPARQWMLILSGRGQTTAGGETRPWTAGDVFLLEDTTGLGHGTTAAEETLMAVVRARDGWSSGPTVQ